MSCSLRLRITRVRGHSGARPPNATSSALHPPTPIRPSPHRLPSRLFSLPCAPTCHLPFVCPTCFDLFDAPVSAATQFIVRPILLQPSTTPRQWPPLGFVALTLWAAYLWRRLEKSWLNEFDAARNTPHSPLPRCLLLVSVSYAPMGARWLWTHVLALSGRSVVLWIRRAV